MFRVIPDQHVLKKQENLMFKFLGIVGAVFLLFILYRSAIKFIRYLTGKQTTKAKPILNTITTTHKRVRHRSQYIEEMASKVDISEPSKQTEEPSKQIHEPIKRVPKKKKEIIEYSLSSNAQKNLFAAQGKKIKKLEDKQKALAKAVEALQIKHDNNIQVPSKETKENFTNKKTKNKIIIPTNDNGLDEIIQKHQQAINKLIKLHKASQELLEQDSIEISNALSFDILAKQPLYFPSSSLCNHFLICSKTGIPIQAILFNVCTPIFIDGLNKADLATLLFACFLHDANSENRVDRKLIESLFTKACQLYEETANDIGNNFTNKIVELSLFANKNEKYSDNTLKETALHRYMLEAATFYKFPLDKSVRHFLMSFINLNDETTISRSQMILCDYLKQQLDIFDVTVSLEEKTKVATYSADILITCNQTNRKIDVEFDGNDHFYKDAHGNMTRIYKREDMARDMNLTQSGVDVFRCSQSDLSYNSLGIVNFTSPELQKFIRSVQFTMKVKDQILTNSPAL